MAYWINVISGSLVVYFCFTNVLVAKPSIFRRILILGYIFVFTTFLNRYIGQLVTFLTIGGLTVYALFWGDNRKLDACCFLFAYVQMVTFDYVFLFLTAQIFKIDMALLVSDSLPNKIFCLLFCAYIFLSTKLLGWLFHKKMKVAYYFTSSDLLRTLCINLSILVFLYICNFSYGEHWGYSYMSIGLNGIIFLVLFTFTGFLMYFTYKATIAQAQIAQFDNLLAYTEKLEDSYGIMRKFKHDYINILTTMSGFMEQSDMSALIEYYNRKVIPISNSFTEADTKLGVLSVVENIALKSLLSSKFIYAIEIGLKTKLELPEKINKIYINDLELSRIIGIFLDNAIEVAGESSEKELSCSLFYQDEDFHIVIRNSSLPPVHAISELRNQGVSSKGPFRGIGLSNVDTILKTYPDFIWNTSYQEPYFTQELILFKNTNQTPKGENQ